MVHQVGLTVVAEVPGHRLAALGEVLAELAKDPAHHPVLPFAELPGLHFGRVVLLDGAPARLVLTFDCDAPADRTLQAVAEVDALDRLLEHTEDFPVDLTAGSSGSSSARLAWLRAHLQRSDVFYVHAVGRSLGQILEEARLRAALERHLDRTPELGALAPTEIRTALTAYAESDAELAWALTPAPRPGLSFRVRERLHAIAVPTLLVLASPVLLPALAVWLVALRRHERRDPFPHHEPDPRTLRALGDSEDVVVQNAFTSLAAIRPGRFWRLTSRLTLLIGTYTARHVFTTGSLSGLTTVHFARFLRLGPRGDLLFTSYYDGSLESYNNDFVDQVAWVLNTVFGQQEGYPRTRWMVLEGAHDERWFKDFIRGHQRATQVWWSAYPELAAVTVDQNAALRAGLSSAGDAMSEKEVRAWLRLL